MPRKSEPRLTREELRELTKLFALARANQRPKVPYTTETIREVVARIEKEKDDAATSD